jgi:polysaccharide biosynthesis/export protein
MIRSLTITILFAVGTALVGLAQADGTEPEAAVNSVPSTSNDPAVAATTVPVLPAPIYEIGPNDVLHVSVWKEPDLTISVPVRSDGMISVPLLNDVQASGLTPMQLAALLTEKLKHYVTSPRVTVVVTQTNSHRIYVVGEVLHSGPMSLLHEMTALQALATAGLTQFANTKRIYILRTDNGKTQKIPFNYKRVIQGEDMSQNIILKPEDTIVVP